MVKNGFGPRGIKKLDKKKSCGRMQKNKKQKKETRKKIVSGKKIKTKSLLPYGVRLILEF